MLLKKNYKIIVVSLLGSVAITFLTSWIPLLCGSTFVGFPIPFYGVTLIQAECKGGTCPLGMVYSKPYFVIQTLLIDLVTWFVVVMIFQIVIKKIRSKKK